MYKSKYKDWILETIDQLRKRKARPDLERICHMVQRKHGLSFEEIVADLDQLVKEEIVIKVEYKGSTSYRNAAKWKKSHLAGQVLNSNEFGQRLLDAVQSICEEGYPENGKPVINTSGVGDELTPGDGCSSGASVQDVEDWLQHNDPEYEPGKHDLRVLLDREVDAKHLERLANGNYAVAEATAAAAAGCGVLDTQAKMESSSPTATATTTTPTGSSGSARSNTTTTPSGSAKTSPGRKGRPPTKRKVFRLHVLKIKKTLGPEFEHYSVVKKKRARGSSGLLELENATPDPPPSITDPEPRCDYCLQTSASNKKGHPEELLICKDCQAKAHPSCMDYSEELAKRARTSPWQCIDCKTCYICEDAGDPDAMLFCDACDKGYHMSCHNPPLVDKPTGKWVCSQCVQELGLDEKDVMEAEDSQSNKDVKPDLNGDGMSCLPTPSDSPVNFQEDNREFVKASDSVAAPIPMLATTLKSEYPDACDWTIDDVVRFFEDLGFKEQAVVFREQEIDGKSLLLMKRSDVLTGLSLKLGPALKIYAHVQRLQTRGQNCF